MLKDTVLLWREGSPMREVIAKLVQMVVDAEYVFVHAWQVCRGDAAAETERQGVREHDKAVNRGERSVRRALMEHLSINPGRDAAGCLAIMSMAKDLERLGDHGGNLLALSRKAGVPLKEMQMFDGLDAVSRKLALIFPKLQAAIRECSEDRARAVLSDYLEVQADMKRLQAALFTADLAGAEAVGSTLLLYYLTRINAHAGNAASAVIFPLEEIDFVGRGLHDAHEAAG